MSNLEAQVKAHQVSQTNQVQEMAQLRSDLQQSIDCLNTELKKNVSLIYQKVQAQIPKSVPQRISKDSLCEDMSTNLLDYPSYA